MEWYVAENPLFSGEGEIALLQRVCQTESDSLPEALDAGFVGGLGIAPGPGGYLENGRGFRLFRFKEVPTGEALDSLLGRLHKAASIYDPSLQAIIFAGDISKSTASSKLQVFADIPGRVKDTSACGKMAVSVSEDADCDVRCRVSEVDIPGRRTVTVRVEAVSPGLPRKIMGTVVSSVSTRMDDIVALAVEKTLMQAFEDESVPVSSVKAGADKSHPEGESDRYCIEVVTVPEYAGEAVSVIGRLLGMLGRDGLPLHGFEWMSDIVMNRYAMESLAPSSNTSLVDRCSMASLRGSDLSSTRARLEYFNSRDIADSVRLRNFNRFARSLFGDDDNMTVAIAGATASLDADSLLASFRSSLGCGPDLGLCRVNPSDTLSFVTPSRKKMKAKEKPEPVLGGTIWTFRNGTRVLYKRLPRSGRISYSYVFRTGAASVPGLKDGEAPYLEDMFRICSFGSLPGPAFFNLLESNGITMRCRVSLSDVRIEGSAPAGRIHLLMKALAAATSPTAPSGKAVDWWLSCRQAEETDSLSLALKNAQGRLHPGCPWSLERIPDKLDGSLAAKAMTLFNSSFSRSDDAMLVILGEQPEPQVLKYLKSYMGFFSTGGNRLPAANFNVKTLSGEAFTSGQGPEGSAVLSLSCPHILNIDNFAEVAVAREILKRRIAAATAGSGYCPEVRMEFSKFPSESVNLSVILRRSAIEGLPGVDGRLGQTEVARLVDDVLDNLASEGVGAEELAGVRGALSTEAVAARKDSRHLLEMAAARLVWMKDLVSRYPEAVKAVTKQSVDDLFGMLDNCGRVVYISENK